MGMSSSTAAGAAGVSAPFALRPMLTPHVVDVTRYAEALRANGAYPVHGAMGWRMDCTALDHLAESYFNRSRRFFSPSSDFSSGLNFFLTNETDYPSAIQSIRGVGGVFAGVGRILPITYAAWQGAGRVYVVDKKALIPMGFVPLYGAMLTMARNRAELLSVLVGRPISDSTNISEADSPAKLCDTVMSRPYDNRFADAVASGLARILARNLRQVNCSSVRVALRDWISKLSRSFVHRRASLQDDQSPAWLLTRTDHEGRGGALSSERAFRQERALFLESRVTGVADDLITGGLRSIGRDVRASGERLGVVYVSNVEDLLLFNYLFDERSPDPGTRPGRTQRYYDFYRMLSELPDAEETLVISAKKRRTTSVDRLGQYVRRSIPLKLDVDSAASAAKDFYRMRTDVAFLKQFPLAERLDRIARSLRSRQRFNTAVQETSFLFKGAPVDRSALEARLDERFGSMGIPSCGWWLNMFLDNMEELGVVKGRINPS